MLNVFFHQVHEHDSLRLRQVDLGGAGQSKWEEEWHHEGRGTYFTSPKNCGLFVQQNQMQVGLKYQTSQPSQYHHETQLCSHGDIFISHSQLGQQYKFHFNLCNTALS